MRGEIGHLVFGVDDDTMESVVLDVCRARGLTLATAESVTGGLVAGRLTGIAGASDVFRGSIVSYATEVKQTLLGVERRPGRQRVGGAPDGASVCVTGARRRRRPRRSPASPGRPNRTGSRWERCTSASSVPDSTRCARCGYRVVRDQMRQFAVITSLGYLREHLLQP